MLYEGAIKFLDEAIPKMDFKNYDFVNAKLKKVMDIVEELQFSLDMKAGDISQRLKSIYIYMYELINKANLNKTTEELIECRKLLSDLLSAWRGIVGYSSRKSENPKSDGFLGGLSVSG